MKKRETLRTWLPVLAAAALAVLVWITGALDKQKVWGNMAYGDMKFARGLSLTAEDGYGVMNDGPGFTLPAGTYRLKWIVSADGEGNRLSAVTTNGARIEPAEIPLESGEHSVELRVLDPADGVQLRASFEDGTYIDVYEFRLYSPFYKDDAATFALLAAALCALYVAHRRGALTPERRGRLVLLAFAVLISCAPSFKENQTLVYDTTFHNARLLNLADALASGQFPARVGGFTYNGYGAATSAFYPDLLLYPFALLINAGVTVQYAMHLIEVLSSILACAAMYAFAKRVFADADAAASAAVLYTLAIYRIADVYVRGALGETLAMSVLPLFLLGLWETVLGDKRRWPLLAFSAAAVCHCHLLTTAMCALFAAAFALAFIVRIVRERRAWALVKAALFALGMCLCFLVPLLVFSGDGVSAANVQGATAAHAVSPAQLLLWSAGMTPTFPLDTTINEMPVEIGLPLLLGAALLLFTAARARERDAGMRVALLLAAGGAVAAWVTTTLFPWGLLQSLTANLVGFLQFPWRFLVFADALLAPAAAYGYVRFAGRRGDAAAVAALALSALVALPTMTWAARRDDFVAYGEGATSRITYEEYQYPGTNLDETRFSREPAVSGDIVLTDYEKDGTRVRAHVEAAEGGSVALPMFGFTGYAVKLDGERVGWTRGENNRLTVELPPGASGELRVFYAGDRRFAVADAASLLSLAALLCLCLCGRAKALRVNGGKASGEHHEKIS